MDQGDVALVVSVCRLVLVAGARRAVVGEWQTLPAFVFKVLVQQTLICAIEAVTACCQRL